MGCSKPGRLGVGHQNAERRGKPAGALLLTLVMAPPTTGRNCLPPCLSPDPPVPVSCLHDAPSPPIRLAAPASAPGPLPRSTIPPAMPPLSDGVSCRAPPRALSAHRRCHRTGSGSLPAGAGHQRCQVRALACASAARAPAVSSGASRAAHFKRRRPAATPAAGRQWCPSSVQWLRRCCWTRSQTGASFCCAASEENSSAPQAAVQTC